MGLHSLIRISASLRCAPRGANPYATDRFRADRSQPLKFTDQPSNNQPILRWDQLAFWWFMLDRQEESGKVARLAGRKPIFATNYTNVIQIIVLDYIRLIGRQNWITFGPNECGGKERSYTIKKPSGSRSRERERRVLVVCVNCRGKVAPSLDVRSGGITLAYSHFGVAPVRTPRRESLCYGQISGCRGANRKTSAE